MRQYLAQFRKQPAEVLNYSVDYSQWLATGETVTQSELIVSVVSDPPLVPTNTYILDGVTVSFAMSGGESGVDYQVTIRTTTSVGQIVEREIIYIVEEL